jgi:hypothetical protein
MIDKHTLKPSSSVSSCNLFFLFIVSITEKPAEGKEGMLQSAFL